MKSLKCFVRFDDVIKCFVLSWLQDDVIKSKKVASKPSPKPPRTQLLQIDAVKKPESSESKEKVVEKKKKKESGEEFFHVAISGWSQNAPLTTQVFSQKKFPCKYWRIGVPTRSSSSIIKALMSKSNSSHVIKLMDRGEYWVKSTLKIGHFWVIRRVITHVLSHFWNSDCRSSYSSKFDSLVNIWKMLLAAQFLPQKFTTQFGHLFIILKFYFFYACLDCNSTCFN